MSSKKNTYNDVLGAIGNTPLARIPLDTKATILAKLEYTNPGGSIKDRPALFMIEDAEKKGKLKPNGTIVEASSGNQGIGLAMIGAAKGYNVTIVVPDKTSFEKVSTLRAYGAKVVICPTTKSPDDPKAYIPTAHRILEETPNAFMPNQYTNEQNPLAHYLTTGPEIWKQTNGTITHFIAAKGSCGTVTGIGRYLKEKNPDITVISVDEAPGDHTSNPCKIEGIGTGVEDNLDKSVIDEFVLVEGKDAFETARKVAKEHGIMVGLSSGAVMHAATQYLDKLQPSDVVVMIFADSGKSYLQKLFGAKSTS